ncbi:gas vesicle protein GvpN [Clostridium sp. ZS2-4]|uniref:gas vesicle protein GvpN n=1 Tax=Clostridium sp. ZS2-4 TaxID=2987703 RepID=UPI00227BE076|nr:gas vesicle protein GvpN [Clostridium sp. ZS2-4]MCY6354433.1 gas vesicle protein GvpN [Clostridium sp. ZS2-4]
MNEFNAYKNVLNIDTNEKFVETPYIKKLTARTFYYMNAGFPIHLKGAAGIGKTALAFHIANKIGRPIIFASGSDEFNEADLLGEYNGIKITSVADNYISSVFKKEQEMKKIWLDGKLLTACKNGYTFIYDEFTRTRPEINNVLLPVLEEKMVDMSNAYIGNSYVKVHEDFRIIFTSNPEEYIGVYKSANALTDRMITIDMDSIDFETEIKIVMAKTGINIKDSEKIVNLTRVIRYLIQDKMWVSLRSSIMLAKIIKDNRIRIDKSNELFRQICRDIYNSSSVATNMSFTEKDNYYKVIDKGIDQAFK